MSRRCNELATLRDWLRWAVSRFGEADARLRPRHDERLRRGGLSAAARAAPAARPARAVPRRPADAGRARAARAALRAPHRRSRARRLSHARGVARRVPLLRRRARDHSALVHRRAAARRARAVSSATPTRVTSRSTCAPARAASRSCSRTRTRTPTSTRSTSRPEALAVAQRNVSDYGLADRINLIRSDLFANLPEKSYDLIISNPPYVTAMAMEALPRRIPARAGAGARRRRGRAGCGARDRSRRAALPAPGGVLVVEVGHDRQAAEAAFPRLPFVWLKTRSSSDERVPAHARGYPRGGALTRKARSQPAMSKKWRIRRTSSDVAAHLHPRPRVRIGRLQRCVVLRLPPGEHLDSASASSGRAAGSRRSRVCRADSRARRSRRRPSRYAPVRSEGPSRRSRRGLRASRAAAFSVRFAGSASP